MAAAFVQSATGTGNLANPVTVTINGVTAGNTLIVGITNGSARTVNTVTDGTNSYAAVGSQVSDSRDTNYRFDIYEAPNVAAGNFTISVDFTGGGAFEEELIVHEVSGLGTTFNLDQSGSAETASTSPSVSTGSSTTQDGDYLFAMIQDTSGTAAARWSQGSGYTERAEDFTNGSVESEDQVQTTAGATSATWTQNNSGNALARLIAVKAAAAGGGGRSWILTR